MAEKRMFAKTIIDSDAFLDMPTSSQALYFHLSMRADDDGFLNNPKKIQRMVGASEDDLRILMAKKFILAFDTGVIVIKHWRIHNYIQKDRYHPTVYQEERAQVSLKENGAYTLDTTCIQPASRMEAQIRLDKNRLDQNRVEEEKKAAKPRFTPPTLEEVTAYCKERNSTVDPKQFWSYFNEGQWMDAKGNKVRNWKQKLLTWERFDGGKPRMRNYTTAAEYVPPKPSPKEMNALLDDLDRV